jgi:hypothetical protein
MLSIWALALHCTLHLTLVLFYYHIQIQQPPPPQITDRISLQLFTQTRPLDGPNLGRSLAGSMASLARVLSGSQKCRANHVAHFAIRDWQGHAPSTGLASWVSIGNLCPFGRLQYTSEWDTRGVGWYVCRDDFSSVDGSTDCHGATRATTTDSSGTGSSCHNCSWIVYDLAAECVHVE